MTETIETSSATRTTAHVETLTATVKTLVVGSRQVTLSVAKQLDTVPLGDLAVFGRVKLVPDKEHVIGARRDDGSLALATFSRWRSDVVEVLNGDLPRRVVVCDRALSGYGRQYADVTFRDRKIRLSDGAVSVCGQHRYPGESCQFWDTQGQDDEIVRLIVEYDRITDAHKLAAVAPLIVLAGLK